MCNSSTPLHIRNDKSLEFRDTFRLSAVANMYKDLGYDPSILTVNKNRQSHATHIQYTFSSTDSSQKFLKEYNSKKASFGFIDTIFIDFFHMQTGYNEFIDAIFAENNVAVKDFPSILSE